MRRTLAIITAMLVVATAVACASGCAMSKLTDFGWVKFQVPEGYVQVNDLVYSVAISASEETDPLKYKLDDRRIRLKPKVREAAFPDAETGVENAIEDGSGVEVETVEAGGLTWYVAPFTFVDEQDSVYGYADVNDERCVGFVAYYMSIDDPDLMTVLETLQINESKLP